MTDIEPRPIESGFESVQARTGGDLMRRVAADLTPFQAVRVGQRIARRRMKTAVELASIEDETILAEARVIAQTKLRATVEQAERLLHGVRLDCLAGSALAHEEASRIVDLVRDEPAHSVFRDALKAASVRYGAGVVRRAGE
jgi:hypothetical protein